MLMIGGFRQPNTMAMNKMVDMSVILCFVLISSCSISAQTCSKIYGVFTPNATYDANRRTVLYFLPSLVTENAGRFYKTSYGQDPDTAYGLGMCIPGTERHVCSDCIRASSRTLLKNCRNEKEAIDWRYSETLCLVRYSSREFDGSLNVDKLGTYNGINTGDVQVQVNVTEFGNKWEDLMLDVIRKASYSSDSENYAADTKVVTVSTKIYGFVQCSKDLSSDNCSECLRQNMNDRLGRQEGSTARTSCFMRWDLYSFWGLFDDTNTTKIGTIVAIVVAPIAVISLLLALGLFVYRRRKAYQAFARQNGYFSVARRRRSTYGIASPNNATDDIMSSGSLRFDFRAIKAATNNFQQSNKLGHGGFGAVYKGMLPNGTEVAAKRLSKTSDQGEKEFKNEVLLVAKLQHRNLVRLLGFSVEAEEKILVYEFVPNKSLDYFLFDHLKRGQLDWPRRLNIIEGITRGILYLHQDSRPTIIHRDLKASNILLDADMNPKIADFGMARNFRVNQTEANTGRAVGTFGYMPPEYVANGHFSTKSDVYSFGVLILEIIGGKKNSSFHRIDGSVSNLVSYVWRLWNNESLLELVDPSTGENYDKDEVIRCIHIGLLCVQENPADRPSMSKIFQMLTNTSITLPVPQPPGFFFRERSEPNPLAERLLPGPSTSMSFVYSIDDASFTTLSPR